MANRGEDQIHNLSFARADFKAETFDIIIRQKGFRIKWEQGMFCSCISNDTGQPDYNCPICKGKGYVYFDPTETKVIVTSISGRKDQERIGINEQGTAYMTPLSTDFVGFRDRITFLDFQVKFSEVITRSDTDLDELSYNAFSTIALRNLGTTYKRGVDFDITKSGSHIQWIKEDLISPGTRYSILYMINPVYIAINPIHELRGTYSMLKGGGEEYFIQLPSQYQIKREDFLSDGDV